MFKLEESKLQLEVAASSGRAFQRKIIHVFVRRV